MKAIMVSVDYTDFLRITVPYNRRHFDEVWIVTSQADFHNVVQATHGFGVNVVATDLFYERGADFNKWAALEWGLEQMKMSAISNQSQQWQEWICLMDADVLWPKMLEFAESTVDRSLVSVYDKGASFSGGDERFETIFIQQGQLLSPLRRMMTEVKGEIPAESNWGEFPIHRNVNEWAGYTQIFHTTDPVLGELPWHETDWRHAGGADSFFQMKWDPKNKVRPPWEVLHLGLPGVNWCGRASQYVGGGFRDRPVESPGRLAKVADYLSLRRGRTGSVRHEHERLKGVCETPLPRPEEPNRPIGG